MVAGGHAALGGLRLLPPQQLLVVQQLPQEVEVGRDGGPLVLDIPEGGDPEIIDDPDDFLFDEMEPDDLDFHIPDDDVFDVVEVFFENFEEFFDL